MTDDAATFAATFRRRVPDILVDWCGEERIDRALAENLRLELARCTDPEFAASFAQACPVDGCEPDEYLQRILTVGPRQRLLVGIRFLSHPDFPFVDIVAGTELLADAASLRRAVDLVRQEYASFKPRAVRLLRGFEEPPVIPPEWDSSVDQYIVAAPLEELCRRPPLERQSRVELVPVDDLGESAEFVRRAYEEFFDENPGFRDILQVGEYDDLKSCRDGGVVMYIHVDGERAGLLATDQVLGPLVEGQTVVEEILVTGFRGRGLAPVAQQQLVEQLVDDHPDDILRGTIDARNRASLATAKRVGREVVAAYHWIQ